MLNQIPTELLELIIKHYCSDSTIGSRWQLLLLSKHIASVAKLHIYEDLDLTLVRQDIYSLSRVARSQHCHRVRSVTLRARFGAQWTSNLPLYIEHEDYILSLGPTKALVQAFFTIRPHSLTLDGGSLGTGIGEDWWTDLVPRLLAALGGNTRHPKACLQELYLQSWPGVVKPRDSSELIFAMRRLMVDPVSYRRGLSQLSSLVIDVELELPGSQGDLNPEFDLLEAMPHLKHLTVHVSATPMPRSLISEPIYLDPHPITSLRCLETLSFAGLAMDPEFLTRAFRSSRLTIRSVNLTHIHLQPRRGRPALRHGEGWQAVFEALQEIDGLVHLKFERLRYRFWNAIPPSAYCHRIPGLLLSWSMSGDVQALVDLMKVVNTRRRAAGLPEYWYCPEQRQLTAEVPPGALAGLNAPDIGADLLASVKRFRPRRRR